jgi:hypothetical protein
MGSVIELSSRRPLPAGVPYPRAEGGSDLLFVGVPLWIGSVARVALAFASHEVFGTETTLALGCALGIPWLVLRSHNSAKTR